MFELVFTTVFLLSMGVYLHHIKKKSDKQFGLIELVWQENLLSFVERNGLTGIDIEFKPTKKVKKKSNAKEAIRFIGTKIPKGYDFIDATFEKGYVFGPHDHKYSSEFIYVINGKIKVILCKNTPDFCTGCNGTCSLYSETRVDDSLVDIQILNTSQYAFMTSGKFHTFEALEDSRCIIVTLPPISRGVI